MFNTLERKMTTYFAEAVTMDFILRGRFIPLGATLPFLNDRSRRFAQFEEVEIVPLVTGRQMGAIKRDNMTANKNLFVLLSFLDKGEMETVQIMPSHRPVIFYLSHFAVQGELHVNADARDKDLLDETRDFFALTNASIYPVHALASQPTRQVPLCFINVDFVHAYHPHTG